jgi:PAS domain-containing protein
MNPAAERITGVSFAELRGKRLFEEHPDAVGSAFHTAFERVARGGEEQVFEHYYPRFDGWFANRIVAIDEQVFVYVRDITDEVRRRRRTDALARISGVLTREELDAPGMARAVAEIVSDAVDAECTLALLSPDRKWLENAAHAGRDAEATSLLAAFPRWDARCGHPGKALRTGEALLVGAEELAHMARAVEDAELREGLLRYAPETLLVVPLIVADQPIGVVIACRRSGQPSLTQHDRALLTEVAPSIALYLALAGRRLEAGTLRNRLVALADAIPALVSFVDADERYQYVNAGYGRWLGGSPASYVGRTLRDVLGPVAYDQIRPYAR